MLEAADLVHSYGPVRVLRGFCLQAGPGEIVGLVGHNGAGKTTFARIVCGLLRPDAGRILIAGREPARARAMTGIAPQHLALYPTATVRENLALFGGLAGLRRAALAAAVAETGLALGLTELLDRRLAELSGGQQRRAQAAAAMLHRPRLLLLDEPTAGVDPETRQALLAAVRDRARDGATVVYATHYLPELDELGASIAMVRSGRVIVRGTARDLLRDLPGEVRITLGDGTVRTVPACDPAATLARLLPGIAEPVRAIDLRQPSLDDLYRAVALASHDVARR